MDKLREELDELLRLAELDAKLREGAIALPEPTALENVLDNLKKHGKLFTKDGKLDGRKEAGERRARKNKKRRNATARQTRWRKRWKERTLAQALDGEYYEYLAKQWKHRNRRWEIGKEEWMEHVQPNIPHGVIVEMRRYDASLPTTLDNVVVYASDGAILFDGKEYKLKLLGYSI